MATYDSADLLARVKRLAERPSSDEEMADSDWYALLTDAQHHYYRQFATYCPNILLSAPTLLTSSDGGYTYAMPSSAVPLYVEVYDAQNGRILQPGAYFDSNADYVWEGTRLRIPKGQTKTFDSGPYVRYIASPSDISGSTEPTLVPASARMLLVYRAAREWAMQGGYRDPSVYERAEDRLWGDLLTTLKSANPFYGMAAVPAQAVDSFTYLATVNGYSAI